jgi:hypothetical protein
MNNEKNRNEVNLPIDTLDILKAQAEKDGRSLKNYLEKVLIKHADRFRAKQASDKNEMLSQDNPA